MTRIVSRLIAGALALIALLPGGVAAQGAAPSAVSVAEVQQRALRPSVTATGEVRSRSGADVAAAVQGRLDFVAELGTWAEAGDVIARVDAEELALQRLEQSAHVTRGEVALRQAQHELERLQASGNAVSRYDLDQARNARDLAASDLDIARAALRLTDERLSRAELLAPFAGIVAERLRMPGEEVARGEPIVRLQSVDDLEVRLFLPLRHVRAIRPGSEVHLQLDAGRSIAARVRAIVPLGDARSQSFEALIDLPADEPSLVAGRSVAVELPLQAAAEAVAVPRDALLVRMDGTSVFRVRDGVAERVEVRTGVADGDWIGVTALSGELSPRDRVVVRGGETLRDGAAVQIFNPDDEVRLSGARAAPLAR